MGENELDDENRLVADNEDQEMNIKNLNENNEKTHSNVLTPEEVRPFPKAEREGKRQTAILTDSPVQKALKEEKEKSKEKKLPHKRKRIEKKIKKNCRIKKSRGIRSNHESPVASTSRAVEDSSDSESEDKTDCECLICDESYCNSVSGEKWVQCTNCRRWAHEKCAGTSNKLVYRCINCDSDDDL
ncbi:hypothetical protein ABEB36_007152 [Hypothenemus hampei]|uniref:Zinc finger PHD-type domain-containing protein n=1 Tax=Hypothenemus hampei TaxID=57062 RepID=A0ABD1ETI3_HYPHA